MLKINNFLKSNKGLYTIIALLSAIAFISIYGTKILNPTYVDWLFQNEDLTQHYLGWRAFRESAWHFPIGMIDTLAYPNLTSIIFTDSIPIMAIFFKMISAFLPSNFQYFGFWGILCFILQGILTAKIVKKYTNNNIAIILFSILLTFTPAMIFRMYYHSALAGQWVILLGLNIIFNHKDYSSAKKAHIYIALLGALSAFIHIYFVLMNGIILIGFCILNFLNKKHIKEIIYYLVTYLMAATASTALLGGFYSGTIMSDLGLGKYSLNLNSFFNPIGWSCIIPPLPLYNDLQYEGFAYLGIGAIILLVLSLIWLIKFYDLKKLFFNNWRKIVSLFIIMLISLIMALSPTISFFSHSISIPIPNIITKLWGIFRASGRISWPIIYIIEISSFIIISKKITGTKKLIAIALVILAIQVFDLHKTTTNIYDEFNDKKTYVTELKNVEFWDTIAKNKTIEHIAMGALPTRTFLFSLTDWALTNDKTLNNFYFARELSDDMLLEGNMAFVEVPENYIFIFPRINQKGALFIPLYYELECNLHYYLIDDTLIGYVNEIDGFTEIHECDFANFIEK